MDETRPPRVTLTNLETGATFSAQFNPTQVKEKLVANYKELEVLGMSHKPLQYLHTNNWEGTFSLGFDALSTYHGTVAGARRLLQSLLYPSYASDAPPDVRFFWPGLFAVTVKVKTLDFDHTRFNSRLRSVLFSCDVSIAEARDARLYADEVLDRGTLRS